MPHRLPADLQSLLPYMPCFVSHQFRITNGKVLEIPLCFRDDYTGKSKKGNQVRNGHETVYNIRKRPDFFKLHESASCDNGDIAQAVRSNPFDTHKVYEAAFTVIVPAENGGESEKCQRNRQKDRRDSTITMAESGLCKSCTVGIPPAMHRKQ